MPVNNWFSQRKVGWQPLMVLLFIEFMFAQLSDPETVVEILRELFRLPFIHIKVIFACLLGLPVFIFWVANNKKYLRIFSIIYVLADTLRLLFAIYHLVSTMSNYAGETGAAQLFRDVIFIWFINVIVFGVWYWLLDAGGPNKRIDEKAERIDFLFPQFSSDIKGWGKWKPNFIDYLFLAFNTSTTFGPTDTLVLSRRVKVLMMIQVVASLTSFAVIAARAVTLLK